LSQKLKKQLISLFDNAHLVYQYCTEPGDKTEAWYMSKDCENLAESSGTQSDRKFDAPDSVKE
jgi:hypothetical protein